MIVSNMINNNGNKVPNQFIIEDDNGNEYFQSYSSMIVKMSSDGSIELDWNYWNYSRTTSRYRNIFLNETTQDTKRKIDSGEYRLVDLNR